MNNKQKQLYFDLLSTNTDEDNYEANSIKIKNMPRFFYKYSCINDYTISNMLESSIYMSSPNDFNDPYDSLICNAISPTLNESLQKISSKYFVSCFSERWDSILMWSHYADHHKGICIQYDFTLKYRKKENVIYPDIHPVIYTNSVYKLSEGNNLSICILKKAKDWKYEKEWRIIITNEKGKPLIMNIPTPISSILFGSRISEKKKKTIYHLSKKLNFNIFQTKIVNDTFKIIRLPL
jgi:hypothetical protein